MTDMLFNFPKQAYFGRVIPKTKFYEYGIVSKKQKDFFVKQVEQIVWLYKLAPETINLPSTDNVPELQIFKIILKGDQLSNDVLRCIDQSVMYPLFFEVESEDKVRLVGSYKRKSHSAGGRWVQTDYYSTNWLSKGVDRSELQYSINLASIYEQILKSISPINPRQGESLQELFDRNDEIKRRMFELLKIERKIASEKQFNKKVELNTTFRRIQNQVEKLKV
jgi:hypothetical protein